MIRMASYEKMLGRINREKKVTDKWNKCWYYALNDANWSNVVLQLVLSCPNSIKLSFNFYSYKIQIILLNTFINKTTFAFSQAYTTVTIYWPQHWNHQGVLMFGLLVLYFIIKYGGLIILGVRYIKPWPIKPKLSACLGEMKGFFVTTCCCQGCAKITG